MKNKKLILMYHGIISEQTIVPEQREVGADLYDVTSQVFKFHLDTLKTQGLAVKRIEECGENDVAITFDDGEMNNHTSALPLLREHNFPAYFFIIAKRVGTQGYMGLDELRELLDAGMIIGSHGLSHEILTNLKDTQVEEELSASKKYLERNLGISVNSMSIPRGFCNDKVINMALAAGYKYVFISERPKDLTVQDCYERVPVKKDWTPKRFKLALTHQVPSKEMITDRIKNLTKALLSESGYNWLRSTYIKMFK